MGDYFQKAVRQDGATRCAAARAGGRAYRDVLAAVLKIVTDSRAEYKGSLSGFDGGTADRLFADGPVHDGGEDTERDAEPPDHVVGAGAVV